MRDLASMLAVGLVACSPANPARTDDGDAGVGCLFCSDATDDAPLAVQAKGTIDQICSNIECHGAAAGGMALTPGHEFDAMINVTSTENPPMLRVAPGDPAHSYVFIKLACEGGIPDGFACMPLNAPDPRIARLFHDWIEAGAPTQ
jgi:hypothetical protein